MVYAMNVEKIKRLLLLALAVMATMVSYYIWAHNQKGDIILPQATSGTSNADVVVQNVKLVEYVNDQVLWELRAKAGEVLSAQKQTRLTGVEVDFFDDQGKNMHLISDSGLRDDQTNNLLATGNVQANAIRKGITLKTTELRYHAATGKITSDQHVIIEQGRLVTEGDGLESDLSLEKAKVLRNIKTYFTIEPRMN